jgi:hypothetical protein
VIRQKRLRSGVPRCTQLLRQCQRAVHNIVRETLVQPQRQCQCVEHSAVWEMPSLPGRSAMGDGLLQKERDNIKLALPQLTLHQQPPPVEGLEYMKMKYI